MRAPLATLRRIGSRLALRRAGAGKAAGELAYWRRRRDWEQGQLGDSAYERYYTDLFGLDRGFYEGKRVLDVGCGPRGSLNWAEMAGERVGLDPLAEDYRREFGVDAHAMHYVAAPAERIPFPDGSFDVVTSFNSLDHVDDVRAAAGEIARVLEPGGTLLIITEVDHASRTTEPQDFSFDVLELFCPPLEVAEERRLAMAAPGVYESVDAGVPWDPALHGGDGALLLARLERRRP